MKRTPTIAIYRDARGHYRWRLIAANGRIVADGAEGYANRRGVIRAADALLAMVYGAQVRVE